MNSFNKFYIKYILKSGVIFYIFIVIGIVSFTIVTTSFKLELITTYEGNFSNNRIVINENIDDSFNSLYIYKSRNDKVYSFKIIENVYTDGMVILYINNENEEINNLLTGMVKIDIVTGEQSLLKMIFLRAGRKDNE